MQDKVFEKFETVWIDINGFTAKDWSQIQALAKELMNQNVFNKDPFKCSIAAFILWVDAGNGAHEPAPAGTLFN